MSHLTPKGLKTYFFISQLMRTIPTSLGSSPAPAASTPVVEPRVESIEAALPPEASVMAREILKSDTEESFSVVESPAPAEAFAPVAQAAAEAPAPALPVSPAPVAPALVIEPARPAPVRPAVGNTGSLFFTADADTPSSVTRHLFEPMPATQPAAVPEMGDGHDLPVIADNDKADSEEKKQDSERSA